MARPVARKHHGLSSADRLPDKTHAKHSCNIIDAFLVFWQLPCTAALLCCHHWYCQCYTHADPASHQLHGISQWTIVDELRAVNRASPKAAWGCEDGQQEQKQAQAGLSSLPFKAASSRQASVAPGPATALPAANANYVGLNMVQGATSSSRSQPASPARTRRKSNSILYCLVRRQLMPGGSTTTLQ